MSNKADRKKNKKNFPHMLSHMLPPFSFIAGPEHLLSQDLTCQMQGSFDQPPTTSTSKKKIKYKEGHDHT